MAKFTNSYLTIDNYLPIQEYKTGSAKNTITHQKLDIFNSKLKFLRKTFTCETIQLSTSTYLPNISYIAYRTTSLWWLIAKFNGIIYPYSELQAGTILYIPNFNEINKYLNNSRNSQDNKNVSKNNNVTTYF